MLREPRTGLDEPSPCDFRAKDFQIDQRTIREELLDSAGNRCCSSRSQLSRDAIAGRRRQLEVWVQCLETRQYFGVAKADVYLRRRDASFRLNFIKGYLGIWLQMLLVTSFGVMFSTFLSGAVAMMATFGAGDLGFFTQFVLDLAAACATRAYRPSSTAAGRSKSLMRIVTQKTS